MYKKGLDYRDGDYWSYEIDAPDHGGQIVVFGDSGLRDRIIKLLNGNEYRRGWTDAMNRIVILAERESSS